MPPSGPMGAPAKVKEAKEKLLLMGKSGSGKSSMRKIIFSNFVAKDVRRLGATIGYEETRVKFLGNLVLNLYDCGGQSSFVESYLLNERQTVFSTVGVLIYVFDIESREPDADLHTYARIITALSSLSPTARVFTLIHKMDLVLPEERDAVFIERRRLIESCSGRYKGTIQCFATTIWNQSLYRAWGGIVNSLIPNLQVIRGYLEQLAEGVEAEEVLLFERATWLQVLGVRNEVGERNPWGGREEAVSTVMKTFKHSLATFTNTPTSSHQFHDFYIKTPRYNMVVAKLTDNTFVLAVFPPGEAQNNCARLNIERASGDFRRLDGRKGTERSESSGDGELAVTSLSSRG